MSRLGIPIGLALIAGASTSMATEPQHSFLPEAVLPKIVITPEPVDPSGSKPGVAPEFGEYLRSSWGSFPESWDNSMGTFWTSSWIMDVPGGWTDVQPGFGFIGGHWVVFIELSAPVIRSDGRHSVYIRKVGQNIFQPEEM